MHYYHRHVSDLNILISTFRSALPPELQKSLNAETDQFVSLDADLWLP
jgi:hypothetical protein